MSEVTIASRDEWLKARLALLDHEKRLVRERDALSEARRKLPWVQVDKHYRFETVNGKKTLAELFGEQSQLIIYHFMLGEAWDEGCPSCSFWTDGIDGTTTHLQARDAAFVLVSNAPLETIEKYRKRMGWSLDWVSSHKTEFNYDFHVSFTEEQRKGNETEYNFRQQTISMDELPGISIFAKDEAGQVYHTYSCYSRGLDNMNVVYQYLDLLPKGRDEDELDFSMAWVRRHDQYE